MSENETTERHGKGTKVLFIDNFDSFTFNLVDEFEKRGCEVLVYRNNTPMKKIAEVVMDFRPHLLVISPGPSTPKEAGNTIPIIKEYAGKLPIFGVCLGLQASVEALGGKVERCFETVHGKPSKISHDGKGIFKGLANPFQAGRYHSLHGSRISKDIEVTAKTESGVVMGIKHKKHFLVGVQFHPESIMTPEGGKIIENVIGMAKNAKNTAAAKGAKK